ncbi:Sucrose-6-phosphate hydrolase [uncultured Roseburia sp.]|uniref:Sucrose-6-phosphate hydrolase n=1 Tax=Brotonthovivens ammoniilytica TaxID=2981725 RepID=A0ABT2TNF1_9FIRM|nr:glycoside hydrolase family 32 protein [Brotonthovivens ammoniilytica]MCU6763740.1 glycoside hydrolase family 32 protein [Brotonthovivens ammoniilytica]SCJ33392.1 Sucrose-6-phosphate hydrolase [uncultured Roseburia sp.]
MRVKEDSAAFYKTKEAWKEAIQERERAAAYQAAEDPWRQKLHLMPPVGWLNDPNGLCYFNGEYHVFYQYSPFSANGGNKYWGHYKSRDLIHFQSCPVMLYPEHSWDDRGVYSGSALIDHGKMYLYYTGNVKLEGDYDYIRNGREHNTAVAVSLDGITVQEEKLLLRNDDYPKDLTCHVRDPKVFAYEGKFYMVLGARTKSDIGQVLVWESEDKLNWRHINTLKTEKPLGYMWECPDLFCLDGQWILMVSPQGVSHESYRFQNIYSSGYFLVYGDFRTQAYLGEYKEADIGFDFYAPQTFQAQERRLLMGWMGMPDAEYSNPTVAYGWQHCMTIPRELKYADGMLKMEPVRELEQLRGEEIRVCVSGESAVECPRTADILVDNHSEEFYFEYDQTFCLEWKAGCLQLRYLNKDYGRTCRKLRLKHLDKLRIIIDVSSAEIFVNAGEAVFSSRFYRNTERLLKVSGVFDMKIYGLDCENIQV